MDIEVINNSNNYFPNTYLVMMTLIAKFGIQKCFLHGKLMHTRYTRIKQSGAWDE